MKQLFNNIINADDYGISDSKNRAILFAAKNNLINSTSVSVVNGLSIHDAGLISSFSPDFQIGLHVNLTEGLSSLGTPYENAVSLLNKDSSSLSFYRREIEYQIEKFKKIFGIYPRFIDSHQHFCYLAPKAFTVFLRLAEKYSLPVRSPMPFTSGPRLYQFVQQVDESYGIELNFDPVSRADELNDILLKEPSVYFRTKDVLIDLDFLKPKTKQIIKTRASLEIVCHPEYIAIGPNQDLYCLMEEAGVESEEELF
jgi:predicted glycoside hydrolase/deacetylase ChbG (UPF0249 family)